MRITFHWISLVACISVLSACGGGGGGGSSVTPPVIPPVTTNQPPVLDLAAEVSVLEGSIEVATASGTDPENESLTFSLSAGNDRELFEISSAGSISFIDAPDFETPGDTDGNNSYQVTVLLTDSQGATDSQSMVVRVTNAVEGRVVDGPLSGSTVFIDLNNNLLADSAEPRAQTDSQGYFALPEPAGDGAARLVALGGTDISTNTVLSQLALIADLPGDLVSSAVISPISSVIAGADSDEDKALILTALGIDGTVDEFLAMDLWALAEAEDSDGLRLQRVNQQIALVMTTIQSLDKDQVTSELPSLAEEAAAAIATQISNTGAIDMQSTSQLIEVVNMALPDLDSLSVQVIAAVAETMADINELLDGASVDPTSEAAIEFIQTTQTELLDSIADLVDSEISLSEFNAETSLDTLFADNQIYTSYTPPVAGDNTLLGKVIDGYVSGATAFLDINFNGTLDEGEPSAVSRNNGDFTFDLTDDQLQCASYVPTVVNVPVGAIDSEFGEVTEAYQMVLPPRFEALTDEDVLNVSPLTSLVWSAIETQLKGDLTALSCQALADDQSKREQVMGVLASATSDVVSHYNVSADQLFDDFIAQDDAEAKAVAVKMVKGLKKSLTETLALQTNYPNATWAKVNYYFFSELDGGELYPNAWYRDLDLSNGDSITKKVVKVSDDLSQEIRTILYEKTTLSSFDGANLREEIGYESRGGDESGYSCNYKEEVSISTGGVEYQLVNLGSDSDPANIDSCELPDFSDQSTGRYIFYRSIVNGIDSGAQFAFAPKEDKFPALNQWVNLVDNMASLSPDSLVNYVQSLPYGFCDSGSAGAYGVTRSRSETINGKKITLSRSEDGSYERRTEFEDGTSLVEVSTIDAVPGWDNCPAPDFDADGAPDSIDPDDDNDGFADASDVFPRDVDEWLDTDGDGLGNNADTDDDNDGVADINDQFPLDAGNIVDSDGDGIVDRDDVAPNDSAISGAMQLDFSDANALGLGSAIDRDSIGNVASVFDNSQNPKLMHLIAAALFPKAWANDVTLDALTNALGWDENGDLVANTVLSNETKFIAEAAVSPNGQYLYLLTSAHIQRALQNVDPESCSIYRVDLVDSSHTCLLDVESGDVQPRSLNSALRFDNSRGGMVFRADGAALIHGFNWERLNSEPEPCGCASGSVWFMSPDGKITDLPRDVGWEAATAVWINDELFAVPESNYDIQDASRERIAIYSAETLTRTQLIDDNSANGVVLSLLRASGALHWSGHRLDPDTLEVTESGQNGYPIVDQSGAKLFYFSEQTVTNADGSIVLDLIADGAESYNWQEQSGVGTDIKYTPLAFSEDYIGYMKVHPPAAPIQSIEGTSWAGGGTTLELSDGRGSLELHGMNTFKLFPSDSLVSDLTLNYQVAVNGSLESRAITIPAKVLENWRADDNASDHINWALPESEIEGFCAYAYKTEALQCVQLSDYDVRAFDMESDRSTRYDDDAVCPDGSCNAFPGVSNIVITDDVLRVYFKDSTDHKYYEAKASISSFMDEGESALEFSLAENGAGEVNIIAAATKLAPLSPLNLEGVTVTELSTQTFSIDFGQPLSKYAALPGFEIWNGSATVPLAREELWTSDRSQVTVYASSKGLIGGAEHEMRIVDPLFIVDSTRRYELAEALTFTPSGVNAFKLAGDSIQLNDYDPDSQAVVVSNVDVVSGGGSMSIDLSASPLNIDNMTNATAGSDFKTPTLSFGLDSLPVSEGTATVAINLIDGDDQIKSSAERQIAVEFTVDWVSDGANASITVPAQTVDAFYVTSAGIAVEIAVENLDADTLSITSGGPVYPATLDLKLLSALNKVDALSPASLLGAGTYHVSLTTSLPMVDADGSVVTELNAVVQIGAE